MNQVSIKCLVLITHFVEVECLLSSRHWHTHTRADTWKEARRKKRYTDIKKNSKHGPQKIIGSELDGYLYNRQTKKKNILSYMKYFIFVDITGNLPCTKINMTIVHKLPSSISNIFFGVESDFS